MSQTLLFVIGVGVFAITVVASLFYGYFTLDRIHQADEAHRDEGVGELGDLEGDGDIGDHGPERRDQASDEEPPECRLSAQGSEIDPHAPGSLAHGCG